MANKLNGIKIGDKVRVIGNHCGNDFAIGELVTVIGIGNIDIRAKGNNGKTWYLHTEEFSIVPQGRWKVGDKAVTNGVNICGHRFAKGTVVTVEEVDELGNVDYVKDGNGRGFYVDNKEIDTYKEPVKPTNRPYGNRFKIGDVVYLKHMGCFADINSEATLDSAERTSDNGIRIATEDERRKHLGLPPVKKDDDRITINITVSRKALREGVDILGNASGAYELFDKLDDLNDEVNK